MQRIINTLYNNALQNLNQMRKGDMKLSERIKYEKALVQLDAMKRIIDESSIKATSTDF